MNRREELAMLEEQLRQVQARTRTLTAWKNRISSMRDAEKRTIEVSDLEASVIRQEQESLYRDRCELLQRSFVVKGFVHRQSWHSRVKKLRKELYTFLRRLEEEARASQSTQLSNHSELSSYLKANKKLDAASATQAVMHSTSELPHAESRSVTVTLLPYIWAYGNPKTAHPCIRML